MYFHNPPNHALLHVVGSSFKYLAWKPWSHSLKYKMCSAAPDLRQGMSLIEVGMAWREPSGCAELSPMTHHKTSFRDSQETRKWAGLGRSSSNHHEPLIMTTATTPFGCTKSSSRLTWPITNLPTTCGANLNFLRYSAHRHTDEHTEGEKT